MASGGGLGRYRVLAALALPLAAAALAACGPRVTADDVAAGRLALQVTGAETNAEGNRCLLTVQARNGTGAAALNVQAAWMAQTDGFGFISDYQVLGDFAEGEERTVQFGIFGSPCSAVKSVELSRAVCTVGPVQAPPQSCAGLVKLDAGAITSVPPASR